MADSPPDHSPDTDPTDAAGKAADRWSVSLAGVTLLGRYRVERKIGSGGMASVYLAEDEQLDQPVVVKVPHPAFLAEEGFRERFERETRDLISLQHPHIVRILARGEHEGLPYLVMHFLKGGSLGDRIRRAQGQPIVLSEVEPWIRGVARAMDFIHAQGVVHRDIKPDNVLFDEHGNAYLSDFGIAKAVGGADTGLTITGATPGSPAYMAPEQPRTSALTGASDQYSLAATIYEALSGKPTFEGETIVDVLVKKQSELPVPLAELVPELPAPVGTALMRALARDPDDRFPSCSELVAAMSNETQAIEVKPPAPTLVAPAVPTPTVPTPTEARTARAAGTPAHAPAPRKSTQVRVSISWPWVLLGLLGLGGVVLLAASLFGSGASDEGPTPTVAPAEYGAEDPDAVLVGIYVIDLDAFRERMQRNKERRPRKGKMRRPSPEEMAKAGMELELRADKRFVMRSEERSEVIAGSWLRMDDKVILSADDRPGAGPPKAGETFSARIVPEGLALTRRGLELPLKRK